MIENTRSRIPDAIWPSYNQALKRISRFQTPLSENHMIKMLLLFVQVVQMVVLMVDATPLHTNVTAIEITPAKLVQVRFLNIEIIVRA